jgi:hypothetical protein
LYTIKLARFLQELSLKRRELQTCFLEDADCQEALSTDTIRLYADALEHVGSRIERPHIHNGYRYTLQHLPLALPLDEEEWQQFVTLLNDVLARARVPQFTRLYRLIISLTSSTLLNETRQQYLMRLLEGYVTLQQFEQLTQLQQAVPRNSYFNVQYQGRLKQHHWQVLHEAVVMYDGRIYWLCYHYNHEKATFSPMMLRLNRCHHVTLHEGNTPLERNGLHTIRQALSNYLNPFPTIQINVLLPQGMNFVAPNLPNEHYTLGSSNENTLPTKLLQEVETFYASPIYTTRYEVKTAHTFYASHSLRSTGGILVPVNAAALALLNDETP